MTQLANIVFLCVEYLPEDGRKRPRHVGCFVSLYAFISNYCAVLGIHTVKLSYYSEHG